MLHKNNILIKPSVGYGYVELKKKHNKPVTNENTEIKKKDAKPCIKIYDWFYFLLSEVDDYLIQNENKILIIHSF